MEVEKTRKNIFPVIIGILVLIAICISLIPFIFPHIPASSKYNIYGYLYGINMNLIFAGILLFAYYLSRMWRLKCEEANSRAENKDKFSHAERIQEMLNEDADKRRIFERKRNQVNDLFRLIELAKETKEKSESGIASDKSDKFLVRIIEKSETIDIEKLDALLKIYTDNISNPPNTESHV